ncbi:hypothetical protein V3C99_005575, partial [Haemonchus contortus]
RSSMLGVLELACLYRSWNRERAHKSVETDFSIEQDIQKIAGKARLCPREYFSLESIMDEFQLPNETLRRLMSHLKNHMDKGLKGGLEMSTLAMLPSFVPELPDGTEHGKFVALDLGGTNLRVMTMEIEPGEQMRTDQYNTSVPSAVMQGTSEQLFDYIAKVLGDFLVEKGLTEENLPLGFTFSYPCHQTSIRAATLLRWTKSFTTAGVIGEDVVKLLEDAIRRDGRVKVEVMAVLNDTVGTIVAGAYETKGKCDLGVIIGTGTNASYMEDTEAIVKGLHDASEPYHHKQMIIDIEWGGFGDRGDAEYIRTQYDRIVDERSDHPGSYCFDKLVAGKCMGEVVRLVLEKLCTLKVLFNGDGSKLLYTTGSFPTKYISEILRDDWGTYSNTRQIMGELGIDDYSFSDILLFREVCLVVSRRSANLIAAAIACVLNRIGQPKMIVAIDGSTYKCHPFFEHWISEKVKELLDPGLKFKLVQTDDGSGKGAALIAAIMSRLKRKEDEKRKEEMQRLTEEVVLEKNQVTGDIPQHLKTDNDHNDNKQQEEEDRSSLVVELSYKV